ncbi:MAG: MarR family transcriptional regulator [Clostridium sp.]
MKKEDMVMMNFRDLFNKMAWLNKSKMEEVLKEYKPSEVHCIEYIGSHVDANVTELSLGLYMTRSAISKLTKKLMDKDYIESYKKPENKKEIYFRLTKKGEDIHKVHENLHNEFKERDKAIFNSTSEADFDIMLKFIEKYNDHLNLEIQKVNESLKK